MSKVKHGFSAEVVARDSFGKATMWVGRCGRHQSFAGPSYEDIEDQWRRHYYDVSGQVAKPMGQTENRWMPEGAWSA